MDDQTRQWRREYEQRWCRWPVDVQGRLVPCDLPEGHDGECKVR
jgi:hypothetical protein